MTKSDIVIQIDLHAFTYGNVYRKNKKNENSFTQYLV